jgi:hypothetical protein
MASIANLTISSHTPRPPAPFLLIAYDPIREKWDNHGRIGFYIGLALTHYRPYHCFIADTNATRICDSVMFHPAPLVLPGASRFDQFLQLTERLVTTAESQQPPEPKDQPLNTECSNIFFSPMLPTHPSARLHTVPYPSPHPLATAQAPILFGIDLVGYRFTDRALGQCKVLAPSTSTDENNTMWNSTLEFTSSTYPGETQFSKVSEIRS